MQGEETVLVRLNTLSKSWITHTERLREQGCRRLDREGSLVAVQPCAAASLTAAALGKDTLGMWKRIAWGEYIWTDFGSHVKNRGPNIQWHTKDSRDK